MKQLETQNQTLKEQVKLQEEKAAKGFKQLYEIKAELDEQITANGKMRDDLQESSRREKEVREECDQLTESLERMNAQMDKVESKITQRCQKIELKMQKKIDKYQAEIEYLKSGINEKASAEHSAGEEMNELMELENEMKQL